MQPTPVKAAIMNGKPGSTNRLLERCRGCGGLRGDRGLRNSGRSRGLHNLTHNSLRVSQPSLPVSLQSVSRQSQRARSRWTVPRSTPSRPSWRAPLSAAPPSRSRSGGTARCCPGAMWFSSSHDCGTVKLITAFVMVLYRAGTRLMYWKTIPGGAVMLRPGAGLHGPGHDEIREFRAGHDRLPGLRVPADVHGHGHEGER